MEAGLEGEDGQLGRPGGLVVHDGLELLSCKVDVVSAALLLPPVHKGRLVGQLVGVGACEGREDVRQALGRHFQDARLEDLGPVVGWEVTEGGTVDQGSNHLRRRSRLGQGGIVVSNGDGGDLRIPGRVFLLAIETMNPVGCLLTHLVIGCHLYRQYSCQSSGCNQRGGSSSASQRPRSAP